MNREDVRQYDKVTAVVAPLRTDDLVPEALPLIGERFTFRAGWIINDGMTNYEGDWYMQILDDDERFWRIGGITWMPLCDLTDLELVDRIEEEP